MIRVTKFFIILAGMALFIACSQERSPREQPRQGADNAALPPEAATGDDASPGQVRLPENLLVVLRTEMRHLEMGMGQLLSHLVQGKPEAADVAQKIHDSFILKQELSEAELQKLVSLLPEDFITLDRGFHSSAGQLAQYVRQEDFTAAIQRYAEMAQTCVTCHTRYASERFPALGHFGAK